MHQEAKSSPDQKFSAQNVYDVWKKWSQSMFGSKDIMDVWIYQGPDCDSVNTVMRKMFDCRNIKKAEANQVEHKHAEYMH